MKQHDIRNLPRFAGLLFLAAAALAFGGASCETQTRKEVPPVAKADTGEVDSGTVTEAKVKKPDDLGPAAPALMVVSGLRGYTEPCGCTLDITLGGIDRVVKFIDDSQKLYPGFGLVDGGDVFFDREEVGSHEEKQERARVNLVTTALKRLPFAATIPGERDFALGADYYLESAKAAGLEIVGNVRVKGVDAPGSKLLTLDEKTKILVVGVAEPELYKDIKDVEVTDPRKAIKSALEAENASGISAVVLLSHGRIAWVKTLMKEFKQIDFAVIGHNPRETDQTDHVEGGGYTLEPYDQGRYIGVLKLHSPTTGKHQNALAGGKTELEKLERQIEHVDQSIDRMPPASAGEESPMLKTLRERLGKLHDRRDEIKRGALETPSDKNWFIWRTIPIEPEYAGDPQIAAARQNYNKSLKELNLSVDRQVIPPVDGQAFFIGSDQCAMCHTEETTFWEGTAHGSAYATLVERDKDYDSSCIGCHVVGYEKPGGSVVGKVQYAAKLTPEGGGDSLDINKDLRNVGCESCHGPGSQHRLAPTSEDGSAQFIQREVPESVCGQCHVPEHSPRFNYGTYIPKITGKGHEVRAK